MKHETQIDNDNKIILCRLEGHPDVKEAIKLALSLREKASELGFNVFYDAREMYIPTSIMPAHEFSTKLSSAIGTSDLRAVKVAFLYEPSKDDDHWKFWENVSTNRGLQFRGFTDQKAAMKWLSD